MRNIANVLLWLIATLLLAVTVPTTWTQRHVIDADGYAALATSAAEDPRLQESMASLLTTQVQLLIPAHRRDVGRDLVHRAATAYTRSSAFPQQFAQANRLAHRWLFTDTFASSNGQLVIDLAPMLSDPALRQTLVRFDVSAPSTLMVAVTSPATVTLQPGQLEPVARWAALVSIGTAALFALAAVLAAATARSRGNAIAALGLSALLAGSAGWACWAASREYVDSWLSYTTGDIREITEVLLGHGSASLHQWLNLTLVVGALLVSLGIFVRRGLSNGREET